MVVAGWDRCFKRPLTHQYRLYVLLSIFAPVSDSLPLRLSHIFTNGCSDNAAMIGWASMYRFLEGDHDDFGIGLRSKWPLDELNSNTT